MECEGSGQNIMWMDILTLLSNIVGINVTSPNGGVGDHWVYGYGVMGMIEV